MMLLRGKKIFCIEDNVQNRIVFQMIFVAQGATVDFERRGRDTIRRMLSAARYDAIILDLMLADGVSGFDLYREIRALPGGEKVPIVAVSAMAAAVAIPQAQELGFSGFIAKPIDNQLFPKQLLSIMAGQTIWYAGSRLIP